MNHKITVIVPVYNAEKYLEGCLRSLVNQTIRKKELEVLLVNDGSRDSSEAICKRFTARHRWMRLINQPNGGPSAARNTGIAQATGRYLMYLDSDDQLSIDSVRAVRDFFAAHEDEVDLVTYPIVRQQGGRRMPRHYRYTYVSRTGVYDCNDYPFFAQGTINVCVRNFGEDNILFESNRFHHEDETYVTANLKKRWKFGYTTEAEYCYNKDNDTSIMATSFHAYYIFEENTAWFEQLFAAYPDHVPLYLQGLLVNDIEWKLRGDLLFPWHYEGEALENAIERIRALMRRVDACMITNHPQMAQRQKIFWLQFAGGHKIAASIDFDEGMRIAVEDECNLIGAKKAIDADSPRNECEIYKSLRMAVTLRRKRMENGKFSCYGYLDTTYFTAAPDQGKPMFFAEENRRMVQLPLFDSCESFVCPTIRIGRMLGFRYEQRTKTLRMLRFFVFMNNQMLPLYIMYGEQGFPAMHFKAYPYFPRFIAFALKLKLRLMHHASASIVVSNNNPKQKQRQKSWLYYDSVPGPNSNAYLQFQHDFEKKDGIERYFLLRRKKDAAFFPKAQQRYLIKPRSQKHRKVYLNCDWLLTSEVMLHPTYSPFSHPRIEQLAETFFLHYHVAYLQDGVHQFASPKFLFAEADKVHKIVVSGQAEFDLFHDAYGYKPDQLIPAGLARYDQIDCGTQPEGRILLAPGWRRYLMHHEIPAGARVEASEYYKGLTAFLNDPALWAMLEEKELELDLHLHAKFAALAELFSIDCPRIHVLKEQPVFARYNACVTDISSVAYDFALLRRYVQYYIPDLLQFRAGMHEYRVFDLPQNFGPHADTAEQAVAQLKAAAQRGFSPEDEYLARMESFFYPQAGNAREQVYQTLIKT